MLEDGRFELTEGRTTHDHDGLMVDGPLFRWIRLLLPLAEIALAVQALLRYLMALGLRRNDHCGEIAPREFQPLDLYADIAATIHQIDIEPLRGRSNPFAPRVTRPGQHLSRAGRHDAQRAESRRQVRRRMS